MDKLKSKLKTIKPRHILIFLVWLFVSYMSAHMGHGLTVARDTGHEGMEILGVGFSYFMENSERRPFVIFRTMFSFDNFTPLTLLAGNIAVIAIAVTVMSKRNNFRFKEEHGSAVFSKASDFTRDKNIKEPHKNIILTKEVSLSLDHRKVRKNLNIIIVGGPGTGKTELFLRPNICQMGASMVITDPKGEILASTGKMLRMNGYRIKVLNLIEMEASDCYNPFVYLRPNKDEDILSLITVILKNTDGGDKQKSGDPFWESAEKLFLQTIFYYIVYAEEPSRQHIGTVIELLRMANFVKGEVNAFDELFERRRKMFPNCIAVVSYDMLKTSAEETLRSVVIMAQSRFAPFLAKSVSDLFSKDDFALHELDEQKTATFIIISPKDTTYNFIAAMFYTQYFSQLDYIANWLNPKSGHQQTLKIPVLMMLDEFPNIGKIPEFEKILAYARSLNVGIFTIVQNLNQLKEMYSESWETIIGSSDTMLMLGANDNFTLKYITEKMGKETVDNKSRNRTFGSNRSSSENNSIHGRELMMADEIALMPFEECLVFMKSKRPYKGFKYDVGTHKNFGLLSRKGNYYEHMVKRNKTKAVFVLKYPLSEFIERTKEESVADLIKVQKTKAQKRLDERMKSHMKKKNQIAKARVAKEASQERLESQIKPTPPLMPEIETINPNKQIGGFV